MKDKTITVKDLIAIEELRSKYTQDYEKLIADVSVLEGIEVEAIKSMDIKEAKKLMEKHQGFYEGLYDQSVSTELKVGGKTYPIKEVGKLSFGQYMDLEAILKANGSTPYAALPHILGILLNDETDDGKYEERYKQLIEESLNWDYREVIPVINFTLHQGIQKLENTLPYLESQRLEKVKQILMNLVNLETRLTVSMRGLKHTTVGIRRSMIWLTIKLIRWMQSLVIRHQKSFISSNTKS